MTAHHSARERIESAFRSVCIGIALERSTDPNALSTGERSKLENYGLECFRLGIEYGKENTARESRRPTKPAPPEE